MMFVITTSTIFDCDHVAWEMWVMNISCDGVDRVPAALENVLANLTVTLMFTLKVGRQFGANWRGLEVVRLM
jgi:hypothetical protein